MPDSLDKPITDATLAPPRGAHFGWSESELIDPHQHSEKARKVRGMFGAIAGRYDLNNRIHSLWRDQAWRRFAVRAARVRAGDVVMDIACGTDDLTEHFARTRAARVTGVDFTPQMLEVARRKQERLPAEVRTKIAYVQGDAQALDVPDASADVVSIAFGIRNVQDPARAIREFARVLRPGGRLVILEFDRPSFLPARWLNDFYCGWLMPRTATLIAQDRSGAYKYLPKSVGTFMPRAELCSLIAQNGFADATAKPLTLGICVCYRAVRA